MESIDDATLLHIIYAAVLFPFGAAMGSFLNVVAYRVPMEMSVVSPPSACPKCGHAIAAVDNIPLLGWLVLGGKCRNCRQPISVRYPLVELATGLLWALVGWRLAGLTYGYYANVFTGLLELAFVSAMVVTFLIDIDYLIILDEISLGGLAVALIASALLPSLHYADVDAVFVARYPVFDHILGDASPWLRGLAVSLTGMAAGLAFSLFIYYAGTWAFRKQIEAAKEEDPDVDSALGLGDVKLMAFYGAFFGWTSILFIFIAGSVLASLIGTVLKIVSGDPGGKKGLAGLGNRWRSSGSVLPFGPFLVAGSLLFLFLGDPILAEFKNLFTITR